MPFSFLVQRQKRDRDGQPMRMLDGAPAAEIRMFRFCEAYDHALAICAALGVEKELRGLMDDDDLAEERSVQIPRRAIAALRLDARDGMLNGIFVGDWVPRMDPFRDAKLAASDFSDAQVWCFLMVHAR